MGSEGRDGGRCQRALLITRGYKTIDRLPRGTTQPSKSRWHPPTSLSEPPSPDISLTRKALAGNSATHAHNNQHKPAYVNLMIVPEHARDDHSQGGHSVPDTAGFTSDSVCKLGSPGGCSGSSASSSLERLAPDGLSSSSERLRERF